MHNWFVSLIYPVVVLWDPTMAQKLMETRRGSLGTEVPQQGPGAEACTGSGARSPQKIKRFIIKYRPIVILDDLATMFCLHRKICWLHNFACVTVYHRP